MAQSGVVNGGPKSLANPYIVNNPFRSEQHKGKARSSKIFSRVVGSKLMALSRFMPPRDKQSKIVSEENTTREKSSTKQEDTNSARASPVNELGSTESSVTEFESNVYLNSNDTQGIDSAVKNIFGGSKVDLEQQNDNGYQDNDQMKTSGEMKSTTRNGLTSNGSVKSNHEDEKQVPKAKTNGVMKKGKPNVFSRGKGLVKPQSVSADSNKDVPRKGTEGENKPAIEQGPASQENGIVSFIDDIQSESKELQKIHLGGTKRRVVKRPPANNRISAPASTAVKGSRVNKRSVTQAKHEPKDTLTSKGKTTPATTVSGQSKDTQKISISSSPVANIFQKTLAERIKEQHVLTGFIVGSKSECYSIGSQATLDSTDRRHGESALLKPKSDNESDQSFESQKQMSIVSGEGNNTSTTSIASSQDSMMRRHCPDLTPVEGENSSLILKRKHWRRALDH